MKIWLCSTIANMFRRNSKKKKYSLCRALAPGPAFLAVPEAAHVMMKLEKQFESNQTPCLSGNTTQLVLNTPPSVSVQPTAANVQIVTPSRETFNDVGGYSLVGPNEEINIDDSQSELEYASVRIQPLYRPKLPSPPHMLVEPDAKSTPRHLSSSQIESKADSTSVVHSNFNDSYQLNPVNGSPKYSRSGDSDNRLDSSFISQTHGSTKQKGKMSLLTEDEEAMLYTKVVKPVRSNKVGRVSAEEEKATLYTKVVKPGRSSKVVRVSTEEETATLYTKVVKPGRSDKVGKVSAEEETATLYTKVVKPGRSGKVGRVSTEEETPTLYTKVVKPGRSDKGGRVSAEEESQPMSEKWVLEERIKHTDEDCPQSGEKSAQSVDNCLLEDDKSNGTLDSRHKRRHHSHSNASTSHRTPISNHTRSQSHGSHHRSKSSACTPKSPHPATPVSLPFMDTAFPCTQIHGLQTPSVLPTSSPPGEMYVFSEQLPDGHVQYYSATPVKIFSTHSALTPNTKPVLQNPTHSASTPNTTSTLNTVLVTQFPSHQPQTRPPSGYSQHPLKTHHSANASERLVAIDVTEKDHKFNSLAGKTLGSLSESGYFSNTTGMSMRGKPPQQSLDKANSVPSSVHSEVRASTNTRLQSKVRHLLSENGSLKEANLEKDCRIQLLESNTQIYLEERGDWEAVASHTYSLLNENDSLLKCQDMHKETIKQMKGEHRAIVSKLNSEIIKLRMQREAVGETLNELQQSHKHILCKFNEVSTRTADCVSREEHEKVIMKLQCVTEELAETNKKEAKFQDAQIRIATYIKENKKLVTKLTDAKAIIYQLEEDVAQLHKANRTRQEMVLEIQNELELARDREVAMHIQLSNAIICVEKATVERDTFEKIAKSQENAKEMALVREAKREVAFGEVESKANCQLEEASVLLHEQGQEYRHQRNTYRREISYLKTQLAKKQSCVDKLINSKKQQLISLHS